ncbi:MAG: DUF4012 domain-containing protein [Anaerolinea sp.]|nr:DUF4012 domain-containing protein [Anaerolinea sp.]
MTYVDDTAQQDNQSVPTGEPPSESLGVEVMYRRKRRRRSSWFKKLRKRLGLRLRWNVASLIFVGIVVIAVAGAVIAFDSLNQVQMSIADLERALSLLSSKQGTELTLTDFERLRATIVGVKDTLEQANERLSFLQPLTPLDARLDTSLDLIRTAYLLSGAADDMLVGLQPTLFYMVSGDERESVVTQTSSGDRIVELLTIGRTAFDEAGVKLSEAQQVIDAMNLNNIDATLVNYVQDIISYKTQLSGINNILLQAPDFLETALGINEDRSYIVLSQNNDEIRPSGGYISTWGWMTVSDGRVTEYDYSPTTIDSPTPPPTTFAQDVHVPDWWIRFGQPLYAAWDGSWYADFPSTANMAMWYYNNGNNVHTPIDGVIAIDVTGFEYLIEALGTVTVPEFEERVSAADFRDVIYRIRIEGEQNIHKEFLADLYRAVFDEWQSASAEPERNQAILGALLRAIQEKHVMLYFADPLLNSAAELLGWTGAQAPAVGHDYLMVADANLGNKSNNSVIRSITYDVDLQADGTSNSRTTINYDYSARVAANDPAVHPPDNGPADYYSLTQIFVPANSNYTGGSTEPYFPPTVVPQDNHTLMVAQMYVPFDTSQRFQFTYHTSQVVETIGELYRYRLLLQKQPGARSNIVSVQISLPPDMELDSSTLPPAATYSIGRTIVEYRLTLNSDQWIELIYSVDD